MYFMSFDQFRIFPKRRRQNQHCIMSKWEGIKDSSAMIPLIWLSRERDTDMWIPLRKEDCRVLNHCAQNDDKEEVYVESGRATVNLKTMTLTYNFFNYPPRKVCQASWFVMKNQKGAYEIEPILPFDDGLKIEALYQKALKAFSTLGKGKEEVMLEEIVLSSDGEEKVTVNKSGDTISLRKKPVSGVTSLLKKGELVQRGFGDYAIEGEEEENILGPVQHLIFVIHGIGETLWTKPSNDMSSLKDEINRLRQTMQKKQVDNWKKACDRHTQKNLPPPLPSPPNRIEIIPIEWYDEIHSSSNSLMKTLNTVTLKTIPSLRSVANDVVFDVLMYMTPEFCEATLKCVTSQINSKFSLFKKVHPDFARGDEEQEKVSLIGHSLGSVIAWDLLSVLKSHLDKDKKFHLSHSTSHQSGFSVYDTTNGSSKEKHESNPPPNGTWAPTLPNEMTTHIDFEPNFTFFLGSPLGCMLTLRGAHKCFDELIQIKRVEALLAAADSGEEDAAVKVVQSASDVISPFTLPSKTIYNIYHPSDPIAYRIEPLLMSRDVDQDCIPSPCTLITESRGAGLQTKAEKLGEDMRGGLKKMESMFKLKEAEESGRTANGSKMMVYADGDYVFPLGGTNKRIDYKLQIGLIENEYAMALWAHTSYWVNEDFIDFLLEKLPTNFGTPPVEKRADAYVDVASKQSPDELPK